MNFKLTAIAASVLAASAISSVSASEGKGFIDGSSVDVKVRTAGFNRKFSNDRSEDIRTAGAATQIKFTSGWAGDMFGFDATAMGATPLGGRNKQGGYGVFPTKDNGETQSFGLMGEAYAKFKSGNEDLNVYAQAGRMMMGTEWLASSGSRLLPSTFEGVSANAKVFNADLYAARLTRMSLRNSASHNKLENDVNNIVVAGANVDLGYGISIAADAFDAKDTRKGRHYKAAYERALSDTTSIYFDVKRYTIDKTADNAQKAKLHNVNAKLNTGNWGFALAHTRVDNNADFTYKTINEEHGATSISTLMGYSDFNKAGERVNMVGISYDFSEMGIEGLSIANNFARGTVKSTSFKEHENNFIVSYAVPSVEGMSVKWMNFNYKDNAASAKSKLVENRIYVDYSFKLF